RIRLRQPRRPEQRHLRRREPDGLRSGRREHARHRLLGRGVRLLRAAPEPGRLRRDRDRRPAAVGGGAQGGDDGDLLRRHQPAVHGAAQAADLMKKIRENSHYRPKVVDPLAPVTFVHKINVPVFMACQFTDEQTGGHCPTLAEHMTGTRKKWFTFTNGTHVDSLDPETANRMYDFLMIYVAQQSPSSN